MIPATRVIMAIHPTLVLLPILGFLVLPCESIDSDNGFRIVSNMTVENPLNCDKALCQLPDLCTNAVYDEDTSRCYLISCPENLCKNATKIKDMLAKQESFLVETELSHHSSGNNSSLPSQDGSSANGRQQFRPTVNISSTSSPTNPPGFLNGSTVSTKPQTTPSKQAAGSKEIAGGVIPTAIPTITTTPTNTSTSTTTTTATTTKPTTTSTSTSVTTTVAQTTIPQQPSPPSPSGAETSTSISPSVPTTPPSIPSSKPVQPSPVATSTKPSPTTAKTSTRPLVVPSTPPKDNGDQSRTDQAKVEVAGDPLTIHLLNTSSLLAVLMFGLLFFVVTVALFLKQGYESYRRKDYTQVDYLINGMYSDSGV
ncbi:uncharacterized protein C11orf24 homolog [Triplophysa rosa]|uniref:MANSC domain-containing protein n=1 Tax=Triplophysa rosa TaxID=992332 RepID=A0A9W8C9P3_TRIRA|nr:uncharacterized protein C11orf24 homolog [Triplophysa rosa]XP_057186457.1 uncharacterized protein C11orf24 homolog [Triplophysa rosa]KAI7812170.1 hypothetical protein IRJ41_022448 [Triplophysa rosa]